MSTGACTPSAVLRDAGAPAATSSEPHQSHIRAQVPALAARGIAPATPRWPCSRCAPSRSTCVLRTSSPSTPPRVGRRPGARKGPHRGLYRRRGQPDPPRRPRSPATRSVDHAVLATCTTRVCAADLGPATLRNGPRRQRLSLVGKGDKPRLVPVAFPLVPVLNEYLGSVRLSCLPRVLLRQAELAPLRPQSKKAAPSCVANIVRRTGTEAGVSGRHFPHHLRHACVTSWAAGWTSMSSNDLWATRTSRRRSAACTSPTPTSNEVEQAFPAE